MVEWNNDWQKEGFTKNNTVACEFYNNNKKQHINFRKLNENWSSQIIFMEAREKQISSWLKRTEELTPG